MSEPTVPKSFIAHARVIGAITFVSRILGLVREMIVAQYFGAGPVLAAFKYAFVLPNLFRKLLGEGALSAAFIPMYTRAMRQSDGRSHTAFASAAVTLQLVILIAITLVGEAVLWGTWRFATLRSETELAVKLAMVMLPYVVFVCAAALLGGILQVHRRFIATTATAILLNVLMIVAIMLVARAGFDLKSDEGQREAVWWLAVSVLVAGAAQTALLVPSLWASGFRFHLTTHFWTPEVRRMLSLTVPVALGLGVMQIGVVADKQIALICSPQEFGETVGRFLGITFTLPMERGALVRLDWAQYLYQFPLGVFGVALATAIFPQLSGDAIGLEKDSAQFRSILARGIKASLFIGLPASVGMAIVALPAVRLLFERGQFTYHDSILTARSTAIYSSVIWAFSVQQILNRGYYALHDMRTPLIWAAINLVMNLAVELPLLWTPLGESAMAVGTLVSFLVQTLAMTFLLARRVGLPLGELRPEVSKMLLATAVMAIACAPVRWGVPWRGSTIGTAMALFVTMAVGGVAYFVTCYLLKLPMETLLPQRLRRRISGR
jgi:putative peptidoglycan lipid II flippase